MSDFEVPTNIRNEVDRMVRGMEAARGHAERTPAMLGELATFGEAGETYRERLTEACDRLRDALES